MFTGPSLLPTVDIPTTAVVLLTAITSSPSRTITWPTRTRSCCALSAAGDLAEVDTVMVGTGDWAGVTGLLRAHGTSTAAVGDEGEYVGEMCT
jgi:hypothetical protein